MCAGLTLCLSGCGNKVDATRVVELMYSYQNLNELERNMEELEGLVSEEVYNQLSIDNTQRTLSTYLKFKQDAVDVVIQEEGDGFVLFSLDSPHVTSSRLFVFLYRVENGRITWVEEGEFLAFSGNN